MSIYVPHFNQHYPYVTLTQTMHLFQRILTQFSPDDRPGNCRDILMLVLGLITYAAVALGFKLPWQPIT